MGAKKVSKPKTGAITKVEMAEQRNSDAEFAAAHSEMTSGGLKVQIDQRTWIYIDPKRDPIKAREQFRLNYGF